MDVTTSATACDGFSCKSGAEKSTQSICWHGDQVLKSFELRHFSSSFRCPIQLLTGAAVEPHHLLQKLGEFQTWSSQFKERR
jgi:hypothetical protein